MKAIISDIHSNLEAAQAVLADVKAQGIDEIYCLGDVVGYGPNPRQPKFPEPSNLVFLLGRAAGGKNERAQEMLAGTLTWMNAWLGSHTRQIAMALCGATGAYLLTRGLISAIP